MSKNTKIKPINYINTFLTNQTKNINSNIKSQFSQYISFLIFHFLVN